MCYLIAKDRDSHGCYALKNKSWKASCRIEERIEQSCWI